MPRTIRDIRFNDIDIANLDEDDPDWEGAIAIYSGDSTLIKDTRFNDIRVDRIGEEKLIHIVAGYNARYNKAAGRGVENVTLSNISFTGDGMPGESVIRGGASETAVRNIVIDNLMINGKRMQSAREAGLAIGDHVQGLAIR